MVPQVEQFPKPQKKKKKKKKNLMLDVEMLLEPMIITIINLLNLQVVPDKVFLNYV